MEIGKGKPVYIVAEVGLNHSGSMDMALKLMQHAKQAGADAVKFQKRVPVLSVPRYMWEKTKETPWGVISYIQYKQAIELKDYQPIREQAKQLDITWFASAWDIPSMNYLETYNVPMHKVCSALLTNDELIKAMCKTGKPIIMSAGMSTESEIKHAMVIIQGYGNECVLCHCNSSYPAPVNELNLRRIERLREMFPDTPIGYSGHEVGLATTLAAVALGACYIERHITLDRSMWGSDQAASVEPSGFLRLVKDIRNIERAMGDAPGPTPSEEKKRQELRGICA